MKKIITSTHSSLSLNSKKLEKELLSPSEKTLHFIRQFASVYPSKQREEQKVSFLLN